MGTSEVDETCWAKNPTAALYRGIYVELFVIPQTNCFKVYVHTHWEFCILVSKICRALFHHLSYPTCKLKGSGLLIN